MYRTFIGIYESEIEKVEKICNDLQKKDQRFQYKIIGTTLPQYKKLLMILSEDKKQNEKFAGWFIHLVKNAKMPNYFWTKEVKS